MYNPTDNTWHARGTVPCTGKPTCPQYIGTSVLGPKLTTGTPSVFSYRVGRNSIDLHTRNTNINSMTRTSRSAKTSANIETSVLCHWSYNDVLCMRVYLLFYVSYKFTKLYYLPSCFEINGHAFMFSVIFYLCP